MKQGLTYLSSHYARYAILQGGLRESAYPDLSRLLDSS